MTLSSVQPVGTSSVQPGNLSLPPVPAAAADDGTDDTAGTLQPVADSVSLSPMGQSLATAPAGPAVQAAPQPASGYTSNGSPTASA